MSNPKSVRPEDLKRTDKIRLVERLSYAIGKRKTPDKNGDDLTKYLKAFWVERRKNPRLFIHEDPSHATARVDRPKSKRLSPDARVALDPGAALDAVMNNVLRAAQKEAEAKKPRKDVAKLMGGVQGILAESELYSASISFKPERRAPTRSKYMRKDVNGKEPRRLLYSDPGRFEYYDDGSLRIIDKDILKAIEKWYPVYEDAKKQGKNNGSGQVVDGRGC